MLYAADLFLSPPACNHSLLARVDPSERRERAIIKKLRSIQRRAALAITGALRSTPTDALDVYAHLLPVEHLVDKVRAGAALRLATRPATNPLHAAAREEETRTNRTHSSPLYDLLHDFGLEPTKMETIRAVRTPATWTSTMEVEIPVSKKAAQEAEKEDSSIYRVYTDGSGIDGRIGASAVLYEHGVERGALRLHLGDDDEHTVFEGEGVGGCLAMALLLCLPDVWGTVTIVVDSQLAVKATRARASNPSHWIWDIWHGLARAFAQRNPQAHIVVRWAPGHVGIAGNERADEEARRAAQGKDSSDQRDIPLSLRGQLPWSCSAMRQYLNARRKGKVEEQWRASSRYASTMQYDDHLLKGTYLDLADNLPRSLAVLLLQLRTGHVPLAKHLHRIRRADSPICPCCRQADESVSHFLLHCPEHLRARQELYRAAGPDVYVLHKLLGSSKLLPHLFRYLGRTGRFHTVHGTLPTLPDPDPNKPTRHEMYKLLNTIRMPTTHARTADPFNADAPVGFLTAWAELQAALRDNPPAA
jgi:ribonuclease HI